MKSVHRWTLLIPDSRFLMFLNLKDLKSFDSWKWLGLVIWDFTGIIIFRRFPESHDWLSFIDHGLTDIIGVTWLGSRHTTIFFGCEYLQDLMEGNWHTLHDLITRLESTIHNVVHKGFHIKHGYQQCIAWKGFHVTWKYLHYLNIVFIE